MKGYEDRGGVKIRSYKEIIEEVHKKLTSWRRLTIYELLIVMIFIISIPLGRLIFKLVAEGKITWKHLFWFTMFFS